MSDINIIIVEDNEIFRAYLSSILKASNISTHGVKCAMGFYQAINTVKYDLAIIGIDLPDQSDLRIIEFIRKSSNIGIIILSVLNTTEIRVKGYNYGADHFFVKPVDSTELIAAIRNLHSRLIERRPSPIHNIGSWSLDKTTWNLACPKGHKIKMTAKEMSFLTALMNSPGKNISRQTLADILNYPTNQYGSRSLDALVRRLRKKSAQKLQDSLPIQTVHAVGYCFSSPAIILTGN